MSTHRILQVITRSDWGGAPRIVESLSTQVNDIAGVACGPGGRLIDRLQDSGIPVHVQPHLQSAPHPRDILAYWDIYTLITEQEFDLVHCHSTKAGALARLAASRADVPAVFTVHGWGFYNTQYGPLKPVLIEGERFLAGRTDTIVCVSNTDYREGKKHDIISENSGTVIQNGLPPLEISPDRNTLNEEFDIRPRTPVIGAIARLVPQKDPLKILMTAKQLQVRGYDIATVLIGSGPLSTDCQEFIRKHELDNVYLPGFRDDAIELLPDFDIFLLPSRFEGLPLTILECLHAGVPVVANDVGGVSEAVDDGLTGFVVPPDDPADAFTNRIIELLENPQRRQNMSERSQRIAAERFTEERMAEDYSTLYESLI